MVLAVEHIALFVVDDQAPKKACDSERGPCGRQLRWVGGADIGRVSFSTEWLPGCHGEMGEFPGCQHA